MPLKLYSFLHARVRGIFRKSTEWWKRRDEEKQAVAEVMVQWLILPACYMRYGSKSRYFTSHTHGEWYDMAQWRKCSSIETMEITRSREHRSVALRGGGSAL